MRVKLFVWLCVSFLVALVIQGCITSPKDKDDGGSGTDISGKWLKVRLVSELDVGGTITADTLEHDTSDFAREFLVIHDSTFLEVTYDFLNDGADTAVLEAHALASAWEIDEKTVTITRVGNLLKVISTTGAGLSTREEYILYTAAFPPASWEPVVDTTGEDTTDGEDTTGTDTTGTDTTDVGGSGHLWKTTRIIETITNIAGTFGDTVDLADEAIFAQQFYRVDGDTIEYTGIEGSHFVSTHRIDSTRWLDDMGDTLALAFTATQLTMQSTHYDSTIDAWFTVHRDLVRYAGTFPPAEWQLEDSTDADTAGVTVPSSSTAIVVDAVPVTGTLALAGTNWYSFTAQAGKTYYLGTLNTVDSTDTYLRLYSSTGAFLDANDDDFLYGEGANAGLMWTAQSSGTYYFSIRGYGDAQIGTYLVAVEEVVVLPKRAPATAPRKPKTSKR